MKLVTSILSVMALFVFLNYAYAERAVPENIDAWGDPEMMIVKGTVEALDIRDNLMGFSLGVSAVYTLEVNEVFKPRRAKLSRHISIIDNNFMSENMIDLEEYMNVIVYLTREGKYYISHREINLDTPQGWEELRGLRLYLKLMSVKSTRKRERLCAKMFNRAQSHAEKQAVIDVMSQMPDKIYIPLLLSIVRSQETNDLRKRAIMVLADLEDKEAIKQLIPLLSASSEEIMKSLLSAFAVLRVREAREAVGVLAQKEGITEEVRNLALDTLKKISTADEKEAKLSD